MSRTLTIIKPDAVGAGVVGLIINKLEEEGFRIIGARFLRLAPADAGNFYAVHAERPFFEPLKAFMTSGPILAMALEREDAVAHLRKVIGATDPAEAEPGTVRALYAESKERNAIHASDSDANAATEIGFFFQPEDLVG